MTQEPKTNPIASAIATLRAMSRREQVIAAVAAVVVLLVVLIGVADYFTAQPSFFNRYAGYQRSLSSLNSSAHKGMACTQCHADSSGPLVYQAKLVGDFYLSLFSKPWQPTFVTMAQPTRGLCLKCHAQDWSMDATKTSKIPHPAHLRVINETRDCAACHRWIGHEETYMQQHKKMPFSVVCASFGCHVGYKQPADCKNCHHQLQQSLDVWKQVHPQVVRAVGPNGCLEKCHNADQCRLCHTTGKTPVFASVINNPAAISAIEVAHVKPNWLTQHGGFALQDQTKCMTCHVTTQECQDCHSHRPPFHGTDNTAWIGTGHEKYAKVSTKGCFECHKATQCNTCHQTFGAKVAPFPTNASQ